MARNSRLSLSGSRRRRGTTPHVILLAEVDKPPTHHAHERQRSGHPPPCRSQSCAVLARQARRLTRRLAGDEPGGTMRIELHHPVAHDLKHVHAADLRRLCARRTRRKSQPAPIVGAPGRCPSSSRLAAKLNPSQSLLEVGSASQTSIVRNTEANHRRFENPPPSQNQRELVLGPALSGLERRSSRSPDPLRARGQRIGRGERRRWTPSS